MPRQWVRRTAGALPWPRVRMTLGIRAVAVLQGCAFLAAFFRGLDYALLPDTTSITSLILIERALPLPLWGWLWISSAVGGLTAMGLGGYRCTAIAHGCLVALYTTFGVAALLEVMQREPINGWRTAVGWLAVGAVLHAVLADAAMDHPRRSDG